MQTIQRIFAVILLALAVMFALRIPDNWTSSNPKGHAKAKVDVVLVIALGGSAVVLLMSSREKKPKADA